MVADKDLLQGYTIARGNTLDNNYISCSESLTPTRTSSHWSRSLDLSVGVWSSIKRDISL